ncbi:MAG: sugar nucleotide-binding protein, partial [Fimbriimonadales bacterium]|nr:sugar nucleotide-binding protein [Fimbriimonadales bacterium]
MERFRAVGMEVYGAVRQPSPPKPHTHAVGEGEPDSPSPFTERGLGGEVLLDITQPLQARAVLDALRPDIVIHCAAMTNVDACERQPQEAYRVNAFG